MGSPSDSPADPAAVARELLALALGRPATLGTGRLVAIDGPAGSGKTTLAAALAALAPATVVHVDDLIEGWDGLPGVADRLEPLLRPLATGQPGHYRRYDWHADAFAETVTVPPSPLLVVEGVGSGVAAYRDLHTALAWVEAPHDLRMARGIERDGAAFAAQWERWADQEDDLFARELTRGRADLVLVTG